MLVTTWLNPQPDICDEAWSMPFKTMPKFGIWSSSMFNTWLKWDSQCPIAIKVAWSGLRFLSILCLTWSALSSLLICQIHGCRFPCKLQDEGKDIPFGVVLTRQRVAHSPLMIYDITLRLIMGVKLGLENEVEEVSELHKTSSISKGKKQTSKWLWRSTLASSSKWWKLTWAWGVHKMTDF